MFKLEKIHNDVVKPITNKNFDKSKVLGGEWYAEPYANIAMISRKKGGKSTVIYRSMEKCTPKKCNVYIFCSTVNIDNTYKKMKEMLKKKKCNLKCYEHFINTETKEHYLKDILKKIGSNEDEKTIKVGKGKKTVDVKIQDLMFGTGPMEPKKNKKEKEKKIAPENIFIFDDLGASMRDKYVTLLLQRNRHLKSKVFMAMHSLNNLMPAGLQMLDNVLFYPNISKEKIMEFQDKLGLHFKSDTKKETLMCRLYNIATKQKYNFLYYDHGNVEFRKNFNEIFKLD